MKCIKCNNEHDGSFGSGKYCSRACANSRVRTDEVKQKISKGILNSKWWLNCDYSHNSNSAKIDKAKETWKSKRDYDTAHIFSIKKWIKEERGNKCEECGVEEWNGKRLPMEVDHIDGNTKNNNLDNLKILCPNCHSQTPTWRKKKMN
jgi:hypothetical protein